MILPRINLSSNIERTGENNPWVTGFVQPHMSIECDAATLTCVARAGQVTVRHWDDPLAALTWMSQTFGNDRGRWIGHINYDAGRFFEVLPTRARDDLQLPLFRFTYCTPRHDRGPSLDFTYSTSNSPLTSNFTRHAYEAAVARAMGYIAAGDVFQVNLSQRFSLGLCDRPSEIYQRLTRHTPAKYGALLCYHDYAIISNSPELFLRVMRDPDTGERRVVTRPIKGTRALAPGMDVELRDSAKDQAELNMIVDLERNDLGRVCKIGSVKVTEPRRIETHPTVYHGVATVEGLLRQDVTFVDLLRATFPGGSVTGAPKIRAMQIIDELESLARGPYCGAIGYLSANGDMEFNVAIRTMIAKDGLVHVPVGGAVVADSNPAAEYEETLVKAQAMFRALQDNRAGIDWQRTTGN